jgi:hypothetical protein
MRLKPLIISITISSIGSLHAQTTQGPADFPELVMTKIPGAPRLGTPILVTGNAEQVTIDINHPRLDKVTGRPEPLVSQGHGLAAPAYWDWDGDGLKDLLIGEFGSGSEFGRNMGNFIRVYPNTGTESQPVFSGGFNYARPPFEILTHGTPYSVDQFCCIGFTPQFTDLDNDGYLDLFTGQYYGEVSWFRGSKKGFMNGEPLVQEGNPREPDRGKNIRNSPYWYYSSASFGDFSGDGKQDMIVGGRALRISKNVGTSSDPRFAHRELLLDASGNPLKVYDYTPEELNGFKKNETKSNLYLIPDFTEPFTAGDYKLSPLVEDWDQDGVLDLLVTNSYNHKGLDAVVFFRGVKVGAEYRFEAGIPLFTTKNGTKALPGISPFLFVTDWNHDGVKDLLMGLSIVTIRGKFNGPFSWTWENETGLHGTMKDPGFLMDCNPAMQSGWQSLLNDAALPSGVSMDDFLTMRHQGYVYVMLGSKNENTVIKKQKTER